MPPTTAKRNGRRSGVKDVRCEDCFFHQNMLCALVKRPCPTFRPAHPEGLRPPQQLSFAFRHDRPLQGVGLRIGA